MPRPSSPPRKLFRPALHAAAAVLAAAGCGDASALRPGILPRAPDAAIRRTTDAGPSATPAGAVLAAARYVDEDRSGDIDHGDTITLTFSQPVDADGATARDVLPTSPGDDLGKGARIVRRRGPARDVVLRLGAGARLSIFRTYIPNDRPNRTPAAIEIVGAAFRGPAGEAAGGRVRITARGTSVLSFLGESYPDEPAWRPFQGQLHAHTGYSDGQGEPEEACEHARRKGRLDFFAVTDHLEQIHYPSRKYAETRRQLDEAQVPGVFVTIPGYEWGGGPVSVHPPVWTNHINVLGDRKLMPLSSTLAGFYERLVERPDDVVGQFNHPGVSPRGSMGVDLWDDFAYDARADRRMRLIRTDPGKHDDHVGYIPCLDRGWHVSPQSSEDNHERDWGTKDPDRTGVWAPGLTRDAILEALREMRTFSTSDTDAVIRARADGLWAMGSTLYGDGPHTLEVSVLDRDGDGFDAIELVTIGGEVAGAHLARGAARAEWSVTVDPPGDRWYFFRAIQADGDRLYSAPFFIDR